MDSKNLLIVAGVGLGLYGMYLLLTKKHGCGCHGKKGGKLLKKSTSFVYGKKPPDSTIVSDAWLREFDASNRAIFPNYYDSKEQLGPQNINNIKTVVNAQALIMDK